MSKYTMHIGSIKVYDGDFRLIHPGLPQALLKGDYVPWLFVCCGAIVIGQVTIDYEPFLTSELVIVKVWVDCSSCPCL